MTKEQGWWFHMLDVQGWAFLATFSCLSTCWIWILKSESTVCFLGVFLKNTCDAPFPPLYKAFPHMIPSSGMCTVARATRYYPSFKARFMCHFFYHAAPNLLSQNEYLSDLSPVSFCISWKAHIQPTLQLRCWTWAAGGGGWICIPTSPTNL